MTKRQKQPECPPTQEWGKEMTRTKRSTLQPRQRSEHCRLPLHGQTERLSFHVKPARERRKAPAITHTWDPKHDSNGQSTRRKQTHGHRGQTCGCEGRGWGGGAGGPSTNTGQGKSRVPPQNTGGYVQCPEINRSGRECERKRVCVHIYTHTHIHTRN